jgi:DNA-binding NarL/FixJ family response regulator
MPDPSPLYARALERSNRSLMPPNPASAVGAINRRTPSRSCTSYVMKEVDISVASGGPTVPRSCARCGNGFHTRGKEYTCPACRKPKSRSVQKPGHPLSFREQQIVALIAEAKANKEIAYDLCLSEGTVKEYLYHIFRKLNVTSRTELALRSLRDGFIDRALM